MTKSEVLSIVDEVMNNREIDSIRNAILAIRDKILDLPDRPFGIDNNYFAVLRIRGKNCCLPPMGVDGSQRDESRYAVIDMAAKVDTGLYGEIWYTNDLDEIPHWRWDF